MEINPTLVPSPPNQMTDEALIEILQRAAAIWFKNTDLILLEEFIRRFKRYRDPPGT